MLVTAGENESTVVKHASKTSISKLNDLVNVPVGWVIEVSTTTVYKPMFALAEVLIENFDVVVSKLVKLDAEACVYV